MLFFQYACLKHKIVLGNGFKIIKHFTKFLHTSAIVCFSAVVLWKAGERGLPLPSLVVRGVEFCLRVFFHHLYFCKRRRKGPTLIAS